MLTNVAPSNETPLKSTSGTRSSPNPLTQLFSYVKDSIVKFKDGVSQMHADHRRCSVIRSKQSSYAKAIDIKRLRGVKGMQTGGISYEEYNCLRMGLIDRNKLFAVVMVSVCLPNYFVYYMWSFPDMMPSPFLNGKSVKEISRERCSAVISTLLDIEKGARIAPWTSKLNPFGKRATDRAMERLSNFTAFGSSFMDEYGAYGSAGGRLLLAKMRPQIYTAAAPTKQQLLLAGNIIPKHIMKGLGKAIGSDPLNKGSSPFGIGPVKHIGSVTLADEFLVDQKVDLESLSSQLLAEACSARLIGGPDWSDDERSEALSSWLEQTEIQPRKQTMDGKAYYNGNLARFILMCYNSIDGTRDDRSDSLLVRSLYQGQKKDEVIISN